MELRALDSTFTPTGGTKLKYYDLSWDRKYYDTGNFLIQIRSIDYYCDMKYIYTDERPELGMIQKVEYSDDKTMVVLSGFFYERKLADKIVYPMFTQYGTRSKFVADAVRLYKSDIPKLTIDSYVNSGDSVQKQETGGTLENLAHQTLQVEEKAFRCVYDYENDSMKFQIYQGKDRTQDQTENNFVTFSKGFRNIKNVKATTDDSNYKNYFVVGGSGEDSDRIYEIVDLSGGGYKQQLFIDCKNEKYDPDKQTLGEYKAGLTQKAIEKAQDYVKINNIEFDALANVGSKYLDDYELGDKCDIIIEPVGMSFQARIIEVLETWNSGKHTVTLTFGDKIPTKYEKARVN